MRISACIGLFGVLISFWAGNVGASQAQKEDPLKAIEKANADFATAYAKGDAAAVADMYTENARLLPPNAEVIEGRKAIAAFWKSVMDGDIKTVELKTVEVESFGETITEQGSVTLYDVDKRVVDRGKYFVMWKRVDSQWRLHRDCWNSSEPTTKK